MSYSYDKYYFLTSCGAPYKRTEHWLAFFGGIADRIVEDIGPETVLDAGCAMGFLVEALRDRGVEAYGIDVSEYAIGEVREDIKKFCKVGSILDPLERQYDLIITIEVMEHLTPEEGKKAIENLCRYTDDILFTSTPYDFKEATHQNVQPPEYWAEIFARNGFIRDIDYDAGYITEHAMRFVRTRKKMPAIVRDYERKNYVCSLENKKLRELSLEMRDKLSQQYTTIERLTAENEILKVEGERRQILEQEIAKHEGVVAHLKTEISEKNKEKTKLTQHIHDLNRQVHELRAELDSIHKSIVWRITTIFHTRFVERVLPISSKRRKTYDLFLRGGRILVNNGWKSLWMSFRAYRTYQRSRWKTDEEYSLWILDNEPSTSDLLQQKKDSKNFIYSPCISIITPVYNPPPEVLKDMIYSVLDQTYDNWELCIVDGNSESTEVRSILKKFSDKDSRIKIKLLDKNYGISGNSNIALSLATGEFIALLDHDDTLAPFALFEVVKVLNEYKNLDFIYSDKDLISEDGECRYSPLFKPDWSPEIMLSANYLTHLCVIRKNIIDNIGGFCEDVDGAQDWDLFLRVTEKTRSIFHIPKVLYHWRSITTSCAAGGVNAKPYVVEAQRITIERHLKRCGLSARVNMRDPGVWHIQWDLPIEKSVSIIIPSENISSLKNCVTSILSLTDYVNYEVVVIDLGLDKTLDSEFYEYLKSNKSIKIINYSGVFNSSLVNNIGSHHAQGELFLFLSDKISVISSDWLEEMVGWSIQEKVGVVGAKLLSSDRIIQHAGVIIGLTGSAGYPFAGNSEYIMGPFGFTDWYRDYLAVTGACMMVRREVFEEVGGFDESFTLYGSDVEFCLRVYQKGYRNIYNPFAKLEHPALVSKETPIPKDDFQRSYQCYKSFIEIGDPFFNRNLSYWSNVPRIRRPGEKEPIDFVKEVVEE